MTTVPRATTTAADSKRRIKPSLSPTTKNPKEIKKMKTIPSQTLKADYHFESPHLRPRHDTRRSGDTTGETLVASGAASGAKP
ncbi:hypothetical protein N665_0373s0035 [Sinapis alba]|nr:hypothetical protein N665_0373s0035 [Sinapis alba]